MDQDENGEYNDEYEFNYSAIIQNIMRYEMQNDQSIMVDCNESNAAQVNEILKVIYRLGGFPHVSVKFE